MWGREADLSRSYITRAFERYEELTGNTVNVVPYSPDQMEQAVIDVPDEFSGIVIEKLSFRKGELQGMSRSNGGYTCLEFLIPSRGLIGYRGEYVHQPGNLSRKGYWTASLGGVSIRNALQ